MCVSSMDDGSHCFSACCCWLHHGRISPEGSALEMGRAVDAASTNLAFVSAKEKKEEDITAVVATLNGQEWGLGSVELQWQEPQCLPSIVVLT